ncbi:Hypp545 [Branchiostoma lanceolatum]|uniref:Hypp545 protein n=1 Tax=Branchiostoma lanceolatum TaxID=7740 RepID=A0A8J9WDU0_BRALA|nr:Hypp545 [Branchiostoma lanceolatum]
MDPLHRQVILDCYDDVVRDMDPVLVLRYSTVNWRDGEPGFIRAKARTEGPDCGARALLDTLLAELPYDGFDDFVQSLREVPYQHLVKQLLESRACLQTAVKRGEKRRKDLGRRPQDVTKWTVRRLGAVSIFLATLMICAWLVTVYHTNGMDETPLMVVFPRRMKTFVGREDVFSKIDACLEQNQTCLIKGLGGVGKTSLAIEYGHRRAGRYPGGVFWVRLASKGDLYFEAILGLPRESKEFDILEFAREDWHDLLGDPGVLKSVLSVTSTQNSKFRKTGLTNLQQDSIPPVKHLLFHIENIVPLYPRL